MGDEDTCWKCMGEGAWHDCGEDCCPCARPWEDDLVTCDECGGSGEITRVVFFDDFLDDEPAPGAKGGA